MPKKSSLLFTLDLLILSILREKDCYGYELIKVIAKETNDTIVPKMGTMYPVLYNLLDKHYISSYEVPIKTKTRVYYHIEEDGIVYLEKLINEFNVLVNAIHSIIGEGDTNEKG